VGHTGIKPDVQNIVFLFKIGRAALGHLVPTGTSFSAGQSNQTSELSFLKIWATWSMMPPSAIYSPQSLQEKAVIGTPQER
jgi:hypothetical protein